MVQIHKKKRTAQTRFSPILRGALVVLVLLYFVAFWVYSHYFGTPLQTTTETSELTDAGLCSCNSKIPIQMSAIPHSASTTTDHFFEFSHAWNTSLSLEERGFECDGGTVVEKATTQSCQNQIPCVFQQMTYIKKAHENYSSLKHRLGNSSAVITTLRDPAQTILSHYKMRDTWDALWDALYTDVKVHDVQVVEWAKRAWWRHNLGTKVLSTKTLVIWVGLSPMLRRGGPPAVVPDRPASDKQNELGENSRWLKAALLHLESMPAFVMMHRMQESFELYSFHFCVPGVVTWHLNKQTYPVSEELQAVVQEYFQLDLLLLKKAEVIFDKKIARMQRLKQQGWVCDMGPMLQQPEDISVGIFCER